MKPGRFRYFKPSSVEETVALLAEYGEEAKVLAGGQSLIPMMNMRIARPAVIVDINALDSLGYVAEKDGGVAFGALARQRRLQQDERIANRLPLLPSVAEWMSHPQIRNRGTVLGSIVHADPAAELPAAALALGAEVSAVSVRGQRTIAAKDLYLGYYAVELAPDELATEVIFPSMTSDMGWSIHEVCRRRGDFALAGMVTIVSMSSAGSLSDVRMAGYGLGGAAFRFSDVEADLVGQKPTDALIDHAARAVSEAVSADGDIHASGGYRKALAAEIARRTLREATTMAADKAGVPSDGG